MTVYVIVDVDIKDPIGYAGYKELAFPTVGLFGGKYLARGGKAGNLEGTWEPKRLVILEFPSLDQANAWLTSPEYAPARALRHQYAMTEMVFVEGII
jgi:uncharacterized protein (DUF1330 family)